MEFTALTVRDVNAHDFVAAYAQHLKRSGKMELPKWVEYVKTGTLRELSPLDDDWYFVRAASIARRVYMRKGTGVGALRRVYGGKKNNGTKRGHFTKASGGLVRNILIQLEEMGVVEKCPMGGRMITRVGQQDLDRIASKAGSQK